MRPASKTFLAAALMLGLGLGGCSRSGITQRCWGDPMGVNFCTAFVQQHFWTGTVAITDARYPLNTGGLSISNELSTTTGVASTLGGDIAGEVAQHIVVAP